MTINLKLSNDSINTAIADLQSAMINLMLGIQDTLEILATDGAEIARANYDTVNSEYGTNATAAGLLVDDHTSKIISIGMENLIAEFGAGDSTDPASGFENAPNTPVYAGSFSESEYGHQQYVKYGFWYHDGKGYRLINPGHGLLAAKSYIMSDGARIASEVIKL